jgi:transcription initiation factor IIF auxiliary subunit
MVSEIQMNFLQEKEEKKKTHYNHTGDCQFSAPQTIYSNAERSDSISAWRKLDLIPWVSVAQLAEARVLFW